MIQRAHREQRREEDDLREDHGPVRGAERGAGSADVGERKAEPGERDAGDRRQRHRREGTEPRVADAVRAQRDDRGAHQSSHPDADGHLMKRRDDEQ